MAEVKRKKGESFEALIRKFNKRMQQSGKILQAKKIRFFDKGPNKNKQKELTLRKMEIKAKTEYLKKVGRLKDD